MPRKTLEDKFLEEYNRYVDGEGYISEMDYASKLVNWWESDNEYHHKFVNDVVKYSYTLLKKIYREEIKHMKFVPRLLSKAPRKSKMYQNYQATYQSESKKRENERLRKRLEELGEEY
jgi:hypothetical protein